MEKFDIIATTAFGIESVTSREIKNLGIEETEVENGRVLFRGTAEDIAAANVFLRTADRVLIRLSEFKATTFEDLFQGTYAIDWERFLTPDAFIHVLGKSVKSTLFSVPDCQSIVKKAIIEKMKVKFHKEIFPEDGPEYRITVALLKDIVTITLDTSGAGLHKRGYRSLAGEAPLKETLACSLLLLSYWRGERLLIDPLCGSGTLPIEAAMIALDMAPGRKRGFAAEQWQTFDAKVFDRAREMAEDKVKRDLNLNIYGSDIDPKAVELAMLHAEEAEVDEYIHLKQMNVADLASKEQYGFIVTNPPYGERLGETGEAEELYKVMGKTFKKLDTWSFYILTSHPHFERAFGRDADKKRKLYNGRLECRYYQYYGPKPPKIKT